MDFKKILGSSFLVGGIGLFNNLIISHAIEYKQERGINILENDYNKLYPTTQTSDGGFIASFALESEEVLQEVTTYSSAFKLSDWTYTEDATSITLTKYNGSLTSIYVPGDYQGKQVIIEDFTIFPASMVDLTLEEVNGKKVGLVTNSLFHAFSSNQKIQTLDLSGLDTSKATNMSYMFHNASSLRNLNVDGWDTSNVTNMSAMFSGLSRLSSLDISNWDTSKVTNMKSMFANTSRLSSLDLSNWDTSNVTNMKSMFSGTTSLSSLDVSNWDTSKVTDMSSMFYTAARLTSLDVSNWDTSSVVFMHEMFYNAINLTSLDVTTWDTSNVERMDLMFCGTESLTSLDLSHWDTSNVISMSGMFASATGLTSLDLSHWNTLNVTDMSGMFQGVTGLTSLDLSHWNTLNVTDMTGMFAYANNLRVIDMSHWDISNTVSMYGMFMSMSKAPLLVITKNETFINYDFKSDNRTGIQLTLDANEGTFSDGTSLIKLPEFYTIDSAEESSVEAFILSAINQIEAPTREVHRLEGWSTTPVTSTGLQKVLDQLTQTYMANWISTNQAPVIKAQNRVIQIGETFNALDGVTVQDAEDGEITLTESNIIKNTINPDQAGVYEVTYQVTDRHGLTTEKTIQVRVNALPVIEVDNQVIHAGQPFNLLDWVKVSDVEDGEITLTESNIIKNTINPDQAGVYEVTYQVSDSDGGLSEKTIQVRVNALPVIEVQDQVFFKGDVFDPMGIVSAYDLEDGEYSLNQIQILKNEVNPMIPDVYEVTYQIIDQHGVAVQKTIKVLIKDQPIIEDIEPDEEIETPNLEENIPDEEVDTPEQEMIDTGFSRATSLMLGVSSLFVGVWHLRRKKN